MSWGIGVFITIILAGGGYIIKEIKRNRHKFDEMVRDLNAKTAAEDPEEVNQTVMVVLENPQASLMDKAIASAVSLQREGKKDDAIERWRAVALVSEESDNDLAARAWLSIGYLCRESPGDSILAYDQAIRLKPDYADAYYNRATTKVKLGRYEDTVADYNEAIRLKPDHARAYGNRGAEKTELDLKDAARKDFETALKLARDANNADLVAKVVEGGEVNADSIHFARIDLAVVHAPWIPCDFQFDGLVAGIVKRG